MRHTTLGQLRVQTIPVTPFQQNCALIWDSETLKGAVIDPGGDVPDIIEAATKAGVTVENIFITHGHLDHAGGALELSKTLGVPITGSDIRDKFLFEDMPEQGKRFKLKIDPVMPDQWLTEGETISIGGHEFSVLHCPGHTPGHVVFVNHAAKFMVVGDVLFRNSIGRTDFPYGDGPALIAGIIEKLLPLGDDFKFICGHGMGSSIGAERRSNPFLQ